LKSTLLIIFGVTRIHLILGASFSFVIGGEGKEEQLKCWRQRYIWSTKGRSDHEQGAAEIRASCTHQKGNPAAKYLIWRLRSKRV
jgi:hypothetical protein